MKIAQLAPPWLPVPPVGYGGTEAVVHNLTEGLVKRGHEVTLFATGDSETKANLSYIFPKALGNSGNLKRDPLLPFLHFIECFERALEFDIIHNHAQYWAMFLADLVRTPVVHTIHGSFAKSYTPQGKLDTLKKFKNHNFISISNAQRKDMPELNYVATVYNGIDLEQFQFSEEQEGYLLWIGRITPKKGVVEAINVAKKMNIPLKIAAAIDPIDQEYFDREVKPKIDGNLIRFEGEALFKDKINLYQKALCVLYPISWEEPFGLVMAESMACGTPVIAFARGSVPEVIKDGVAGFVVRPESFQNESSFVIEKNGEDGLTEAIKRIGEIDRKACRRHVEENFSIERMVEDYEKAYEKILNEQHK